MALTSTNLNNGGNTAHYRFQYDTSLSAPINPGGPEPARTNAVIDACENDFNLIVGWFGNIALDVNLPIPVNVIPPGQPGACPGPGACWGLSSGNLTITISNNNINAVDMRYLLVSEMVEQFMRAQGKGWFGSGTEGSEGEGLSRFLAAQFLAVNGLGTPPPGFDNSNAWLSSSRADFVNNTRATNDGPDEVTGCSLLFIYYLFSQLGFTIEAIVAAGAHTLAGVYRNLTGDTANPFPLFKHQLDIIYPGTSTITGPNLDNPYPIGKKVLWHNSLTNETQIWFMNGERIARRATVLGENGAAAFVGPPWRIVGTGNMNLAGSSDIVWHNSLTNETQIWFMDGERLRRRGTVLGEDGAAAFVGPPWLIVESGDMDGDGSSDILWHNSSTDDLQFWFMTGSEIKGRNGVVDEAGEVIRIGTPWSIAGVTDFASETAVLWHNSSTDDLQFWFMTGSEIKGRNGVVDETGGIIRIGPPWSIVGVTGGA